VTRKYEQHLRAESAQQTRQRILDALASCLREAPAQPVSIDQVARIAGVARPTIYLVFGSRDRLFGALAGELLERGGFGSMLEQSAHPDAREGLRRGIRATVEMYATERDLLRALISTGQLDADTVGGATKRMEQGRAIGARSRAQRLADQHLLRSDITIEDAASILYTLTSFDAFDLLYTGRELTVERVADLLVASVERSLCVPKVQSESA
jgi:AcrR family transcriptional regulator